MALDQQRDYHNCKPPTPTPHDGVINFAGEEEGSGGSLDLNTGRWYWNEVGNGTNSSFPGVGEGPNGEDMKNITSATRAEVMYRYELLEPGDNDDWNYVDDIELDDSGLLSTIFYDQPSVGNKYLNRSIKQFENYCRPTYAYEEEYFQHVFNWPTTHEVVSKQIGGVVQEKIDTYTTEDVEGSDPPAQNCNLSTSYNYITVNDNSTAHNLTLQKVQSKIYYIDDDWTYEEVLFNPDGSISSSAVKDRIGDPIIYHGGTDDKRKLFFHYSLPANKEGTNDVLGIGDTVAGATVTNVVNYIVTVAVSRIVSFHGEKNKVDRGPLPTSDPDYNSVKSWMKVSKTKDIKSDDDVWGEGLADGTKVVKVDTTNSIVYLNKTIRKRKLRRVYFQSQAVNKVNRTTLCYAEVSSDLNLTADTDYNVTRNDESTGITITARAGAGIVNRSAVVGTYYSKGKKEVEYIPMFYAADANCEKIDIEDDNAIYTLGTRVYQDNEKEESLLLVRSPKTEESYYVAAMYLSATNGLASKEELEDFLKYYYDNNNNYVATLKYVNDFVKSKNDGKKIAGSVDDSCGDLLQFDYNKIYNPFEELDQFKDSSASVSRGLGDAVPCEIFEPVDNTPQTVDDAKQLFEDIMDGLQQQPSFLNDEYYKRLLGDENSLMKRIEKGLDTAQGSIPTETDYSNLPPQIEGQDSSNRVFRVKNYRDMPPAMDRVKFFLNDLVIGSEEDMNPVLDLDPATTRNQPKLIFSSFPAYTGATTTNHTQVIASPCGNDVSATLIETPITVDANGVAALDTIALSTGSISPSSVTCPDPPPLCPPGNYQVFTYTWLESTSSSTRMKDKKYSYEQNGYIKGTNWHVNPNIRDLDNDHWPDDSLNDEADHLTTPAYEAWPPLLWSPNVSYQRDFHKLFWFRPNEISQLIGASLFNIGNPYQDSPVLAKITKSIGTDDIEIEVESTKGFLSSGYLIIPKYIKKIFTLETGNENSTFTYSGEEIIYYGSKTKRKFKDCVRNCFPDITYDEIIPVTQMENGVKYQIVTPGDVDWQSLGAPSSEVDTIFDCKREALTEGIVKIQLIFEYKDKPSVSGTALRTVSWSGTDFEFEQDQNTTEGRDKDTHEISNGVYNMNVVGNSGGFRVEKKKKICFYDNDGDDCNASVELNVKDKYGQNIDVEFDDDGNLIVGDLPSGGTNGTVRIYGQFYTKDEDCEIPVPELIAGVLEPAMLPSISSYDKGHSVAQFWVNKLRVE